MKGGIFFLKKKAGRNRTGFRWSLYYCRVQRRHPHCTVPTVLSFYGAMSTRVILNRAATDCNAASGH